MHLSGGGLWEAWHDILRRSVEGEREKGVNSVCARVVWACLRDGAVEEHELLGLAPNESSERGPLTERVKAQRKDLGPSEHEGTLTTKNIGQGHFVFFLSKSSKKDPCK